jgi:hypothetical protein
VIRSLGRAVAAALLAAFGGAIALAVFYGRSPTLRVDFDVTPPRGVIDGVYPSELEASTGRTFAWSRETVRLDLTDIDRQVDWLLHVRVRGARPRSPNPDLLFYVDGVLPSPTTGVDYGEVQVPVPARPRSRLSRSRCVRRPRSCPGLGSPGARRHARLADALPGWARDPATLGVDRRRAGVRGTRRRGALLG